MSLPNLPEHVSRALGLFIDELLAELERARECGGRAAAASVAMRPCRVAMAGNRGGMAAALHAEVRRFLAAPTFDIDREGLELAAESFARKRRH